PSLGLSIQPRRMQDRAADLLPHTRCRPRSCRSHCASLTLAAGKNERLACHPTGVVGCKKHSRTRDVLRLGDAAERRLRLDLPAEVALVVAGGAEPFCFDHTGIERIDANFPGSELYFAYEQNQAFASSVLRPYLCCYSPRLA